MEDTRLVDRILQKFEYLRSVRLISEEKRWNALSLADHRTESASISRSPAKKLMYHSRTAQNNIDDFVTFFQGNLVSPNMPWLKLVYETADKTAEQDETPGANNIMGRVTKAVTSELMSSNFYSEYRLATKDKYVQGISAVMIRNDPARNMCVYETLTPWNYWVDTNAYGQYDTFFFLKQMTVDKAYEMFGEKLPKHLVDEYRSDSIAVQRVHDFLLCIEPTGKLKRSILKDEKRFSVTWLYKGCSTGLGSSVQPEIITSDGMDYMPVVVSVWDRDGDNPYGTSPVIRNESEIRKSDRLAYEVMLSVNKINHPAYAMTQQMYERFSDDPGARNVVQSMDQIPRPLDTSVTIDGALRLQEMQDANLDRIFNSNMFNYLSRQDKVFTATQVNTVKSEQLSLMSAVFGNFQSEIELLINLTIRIMAENRRLPKGLEDVIDGRGRFRVTIDSTLAQELKTYTQRDASVALLEYMGMFHNVGMDRAFDNIDVDQQIRMIAIGSGVDYSVLKDRAAVMKEREAAAKAQAQQTMLEQDKLASEAQRNRMGMANNNNPAGANQYGANA